MVLLKFLGKCIIVLFIFYHSIYFVFLIFCIHFLVLNLSLCFFVFFKYVCVGQDKVEDGSRPVVYI